MRYNPKLMNFTLLWPNGADAGEMLNWLFELPELSKEHAAWTLNGVISISFAREEDAIAFRLKFGG